MSNYIDRQAAIDAVNGMPDCPNGFSGTYDKDAIIGILEDVPSVQSENMCVNLDIQKIATHKSDFSDLDELPSAQPERKKGKWIYGEDEYGIDGYHCNKCGFFVPWDYVHTFINYIKDYSFCPNCGADMRGDSNG